MSNDEMNLCCTILNEFYGPLCEKVGYQLLKNGPLQLRLIAENLKLKINQVCLNQLNRCIIYGSQ